jgi:hypothetical protein
VLSRPLAQYLDVCKKWLVWHSLLPVVAAHNSKKKIAEIA